MDTAQVLAFRELLTTAVKKQASDLHLSVGSYPMLRIDGSLTPLEDQEILTTDGIRSIVSTLLNAEQISRLENEHDLIYTTVFDERIRAKVHAFHQEGQLVLSLRFLSLNVKTLKELNVSPAVLKCADVSSGLIIVGGTNGSGRTTLAMSMLEQINRSRVEHILTVENPREYDLVSNKSIVNQREVGTDVASIGAALDFAQKEDIDVLFVSELSDRDIVRSCLELAAAGMLVIAVMNVNAAGMALEKILSSFEEHEKQHIRSLLADVVHAIVVQSLLPRIGGGSVAVHELLLNSQQVKALVLSDRLSQIDQIIKSSRADGMLSLDHELADRVHAQELSPEVARLHARNLETLDILLRV